MRVVAGTHVGAVRTANQDCFGEKALSPTLWYGVVCDGMGGENGGQVASNMALRLLQKALDSQLTNDTPTESVRLILQCALEGANAQVWDHARGDISLKGMGTTAVVLVLHRGIAHLCHVGDSRIYLLSAADGVLRQLTRDHTVVQMLLDRGEITAEEALTHPQRHYITRAVGVENRLESEYTQLPTAQGDVFLLCSDGLYNYASEQDLIALLPTALAQNSADCLIEAANAGGGGDNITALVVQVDEKGGERNG